MQHIERINHLNSVLVIVTFVLAWYFPVQLLFFSYAFLGPAHYLTQISWLHDRKYFLNNPGIPGLLFGMALIVLIDNGGLLSVMLCLAFAICACCLVPASGTKSPFIMAGILVLAFLISIIPVTAFFIILLLPTVLHVFLFTGSFLLLGALKNKTGSAHITLLLFMICGLSFFIMPHEWFEFDRQMIRIPYFGQIALYLAQFTDRNITSEQLGNFFAFLSFAYTYHYLNWFSKVDIIRWHQISYSRWLVIGSLYLLSIGIYIYDYELGFKVLIYLSLLHVLLEFPLNIQTFSAIFKELQRRLS